VKVQEIEEANKMPREENVFEEDGVITEKEIEREELWDHIQKNLSRIKCSGEYREGW